jgi:hypothetical protein
MIAGKFFQRFFTAFRRNNLISLRDKMRFEKFNVLKLVIDD